MQSVPPTKRFLLEVAHVTSTHILLAEGKSPAMLNFKRAGNCNLNKDPEGGKLEYL